jgi:hypothetical protein
MSADQWENVSMKMDNRATFSRRHHCLSTCSYSRHSGRFAKQKRVTKELIAKHFSGRFMGAIWDNRLLPPREFRWPTPKSVRNLTFALAALILKDRAAAIRQSESPALDRDPFIGRAEARA